jgi:hypothetical protein
LARCLAIRNLLPALIPALALILPALQHRNGHPRDPHHTRHNPIGDFAAATVAAEVQTQPAVDDSHGDERPTECNVGLRPETGLALADVHCVVEHAEDGLDCEESDDDNAENGVVVVDLVDS